MASKVSKSLITVLITGAGGAAVPALIESLRKKGYRVLSADMDPTAVGLYVADQGYVIPGGLSPDFLPVMRDICLKEKVKVFVPLVDEELIPVWELEQDGIIILLPKLEFIRTCLDKFTLIRKLEDVGITVPETRLVIDGYTGMNFPLIVKPRSGRGSRGTGVVRSEEELNSFIETSSYVPKDLLLQKYIEGLEYTISVVVWRDGKVQAVVPKEIISKKGITRIAVTRKNSKIDSLCRKVQEQLRADGPFNVQLKVDANTGEPFIFEINPRFSTTISLTIAAGIDELGGLLSQTTSKSKNHQFGEWQEGVVLLRQNKDEFIGESKFCSLRNNIRELKR